MKQFTAACKQIIQKGPIGIYLFFFLIPIAASKPEIGMAVLFLFLEQITRLTPIKRSTIKTKLSWKNPAIWLFLYYLIYVISLCYSENLSCGLKDIGMKATMAILPLFFFLYTPKVNWNWIVKCFVFGAFVSILINIIFFIVQTRQTGILDWENLRGTNLSHWMHRGYWAIYLSIALLLLLRHLINFFDEERKHLFLTLLGIAILFVFIVLTGSKMAIIIAFGLCFWLLFNLFRRLQKRWVSFMVLLLFVSFIVSLTTIDSAATRRFKKMTTETFQPFSTINPVNPGSTGARRMTWEASLSLIRENFLFGVGTGDFKHELVQRDSEKGYIFIANAKLNSHNQFLNTQLSVGILGLIFLLLAFFTNFKKYDNDIALLERRGIFIILFLAMFTESMLETQAGIIPYAFFICFFYAAEMEKGIKTNLN